MRKHGVHMLIAGIALLVVQSGDASAFSAFKGRYQASCAATENVEICGGTGRDVHVDLPNLRPGKAISHSTGVDRKITFDCKPGWGPDPDTPDAIAATATGACAHWRVGRWSSWQGSYCGTQRKTRPVACVQPGYGSISDKFCEDTHGPKPESKKTRKRKCENYEITCESLAGKKKTVSGRGTPSFVTARSPSGLTKWVLKKNKPYLNCGTKSKWIEVGGYQGTHSYCARYAGSSKKYYRKLKWCDWD